MQSVEPSMRQSGADRSRPRGTEVRSWLTRPLSLALALTAGGMILMPAYALCGGSVYLRELDYVDTTTMVMVGLLLLRGLTAMRRDTEAQAVSIALITALSFVVVYEAIFKLCFFTYPWRMPPDELREFVLQVATGSTVLAGFAFHRLRLGAGSLTFLAIFALGMTGWLLMGFPQLDTERPFYRPMIEIQLSWDGIYIINRLTKCALFLAYFCAYSGRRASAGGG